MLLKNHIVNNFLYRFFNSCRELIDWRGRGFASPSPHFIKQECLLRNSVPHAIWVETGTYLGQTTRVLSRNSEQVYSIEPEVTLFGNARKFFSSYQNVQIINGASEEVFPTLLPKINGSVNFWLDGHYSAGVTYKGDLDTPVLVELECISKNIRNFSNICVFVDDVRCFTSEAEEYSSYPSLDALVNWAVDNGMFWHIEHDIFIAKK